MVVSSHFILGSGHTCRALFKSIPPWHSFVSIRPLPDWRLTLFGDVPPEEKKIRPESVSDQRRTYPFPNPVTVNWQHVRVNLGLGRGRYAVARILMLINKYILIKMLWSVRLIHHCLCKIMFLIYNWLSKVIRNFSIQNPPAVNKPRLCNNYLIEQIDNESFRRKLTKILQYKTVYIISVPNQCAECMDSRPVCKSGVDGVTSSCLRRCMLSTSQSLAINCQILRKFALSRTCKIYIQLFWVRLGKRVNYIHSCRFPRFF